MFLYFLTKVIIWQDKAELAPKHEYLEKTKEKLVDLENKSSLHVKNETIFGTFFTDGGKFVGQRLGVGRLFSHKTWGERM